MKGKWFMGKPDNSRHVLAAVMSILALALLTAGANAVTKPVTGISIADAVGNELKGDLAVPAHRVEVLATDGIVTLSGNVDNILAKERAAKVAMTVKGVRAVVNEIEVRPSILRSDRDIRRDIEDALLNDPATDYYEIDVAVKNNVATFIRR